MTNLPQEVVEAIKANAPVPFRASSYVALLKPEPGELEQRIITCIACTDEQHTTGNFVRVKGIRFATFDANPAMPFCHVSAPISSPEDALPVGKWIARSLTTLDDGTDALLLKGQFVPPDIFPNRTAYSDFAEAIYRLYLHRFMRTFSIAGNGIPGKVRSVKVNGLAGLSFDESELFECSPVLLPAVRRAHEIRQALQDSEAFQKACSEGVLTHEMAERAQRMMAQMCERFSAGAYEVGLVGTEAEGVDVTPEWTKIGDPVQAASDEPKEQPKKDEPKPKTEVVSTVKRDEFFKAGLQKLYQAGALSDEVDVAVDRTRGALSQLFELMWRMGFIADKLFTIDASAVSAYMPEQPYQEPDPIKLALRYTRRCIALIEDMAASMSTIEGALSAEAIVEGDDPPSEPTERTLDEPAQASASIDSMLAMFSAEGRVLSKKNLDALEQIIEKATAILKTARKEMDDDKEAKASFTPNLYASMLTRLSETVQRAVQ